MDVEERLWAWWHSLDDAQQAEAMRVTDDLPEWMVDSLSDAELVVIDADMNGHSHVPLMSTRVREFLDRHRLAGDDLA